MVFKVLLQFIGVLISLRLNHAAGQFPDYPALAGLGEAAFESVPLPLSLESPVDDGYDFIIVGAGSAGAVIANRLSEVPHWKILLLEAGEPEDILSEFPAMFGMLLFTDYNWKYVTEPEPVACQAMDEHRCSSPRGKALGGSSVINGMVYTRGNPEDYNRWAADGNPGWSYPDVLPYFLKSEDAHLNNSDEYYHHKGGYLSVSYPHISELGEAFITAGKQLGYKTPDYNTPQQIGFARVQATLKKGRRHSAGKAFLKPFVHRPNLRIVAGALVTKILIDPATRTAYGVEYEWEKSKLQARAKKEVIISASVYSSPQLLMLSGIGPKAHLQELGIPLLQDLPVGQTMYNHLAFNGLLINTNLTKSGCSGFNGLDLLKWYESGEGALASLAGTEAIAFINTGALYAGDYPDVELAMRTSSLKTGSKIERTLLRISEDYYNKMYGTDDEHTVSFTIIPILLHPKSKGHIKLKSTNPHDYPLIYANYLTDPEKSDIKTLTAAIRFIHKICETDAFKMFNSQVSKKPFVDCENLKYDSDEYWECVLKHIAYPVSHQIATCKMGPAGDPEAVVNNKLKVHGIAKLRVADTSVIPNTISGHTHAPGVMIGEVASDLIKKEWGVL